MAVQLSYSDIMLNIIFLYNNYCNIDVISRHLATAGLLCVYVFSLYMYLGRPT